MARDFERGRAARRALRGDLETGKKDFETTSSETGRRAAHGDGGADDLETAAPETWRRAAHRDGRDGDLETGVVGRTANRAKRLFLCLA